ncbi:hypothetical protein BN1723_017441, partial [Verticillium longisporum]
IGIQKTRRHDGKLKVGIFGEDAGPGKGPNYCKDRGCNQGTLGEGWGSGSAEFPYLLTPVDSFKNGFNDDKVVVTEHLDNKLDYYKKNPSVLKDQDYEMSRPTLVPMLPVRTVMSTAVPANDGRQ